MKYQKKIKKFIFSLPLGLSEKLGRILLFFILNLIAHFEFPWASIVKTKICKKKVMQWSKGIGDWPGSKALEMCMLKDKWYICIEVEFSAPALIPAWLILSQNRLGELLHTSNGFLAPHSRVFGLGGPRGTPSFFSFAVRLTSLPKSYLNITVFRNIVLAQPVRVLNLLRGAWSFLQKLLTFISDSLWRNFRAQIK